MDHNELIAKYFLGELTPEEVQALSEWVRSNPAHSLEFEAFSKTWQEIAQVQVSKGIDVDAEWDSMDMKLNEPETKPASKVPVRSIRPVTRFMGVAAGLLVLMVSAFLLYWIIAKPGTNVVRAGDTALLHELPDGSRVTLAKGAVLEYPDSYGKSGRNSVLKGKAYFEVTHDVSSPFRVTCKSAVVEVLGTTFNVVSEPGNTEVDLTAGKVSVYFVSEPGSRVILAPGEKAMVSHTDRQISKGSNTDLNYMAWKTGNLVFTDASLEYIVKTLNDYYGSSIELSDPGLASCRLTASFSNQTEEAVLRVIAASLNLSTVKRNGVTFLEGEGCR